jgi:DegV family protein with EDD domain
MPVAVVTDSTAYLPAELSGTYDLTVVPLTVVINGESGLEGSQITPAEVARALGARRSAVSTSRPAPSQFADAYRKLLEAGADGIVSVHLSASLSGTFEAAQLAAAEVSPLIEVVDSKTTGMGLGFAALAAATVAGRGEPIASVRRAAVDNADQVSTLFYVDTLEFLRRGGRIGAASALLGTALSVKPILHVLDGSIVVRDKVRTAGRALARLADAVTMRLGDRLRDCYITEIGAVVAAHVGPGVAGVVVHRR